MTSATNSRLTSYLNTNQFGYSDADGFFSDNSNNQLYIGDTSQGFMGFILSGHFYSTNTHVSDTYSLGTCNNCLSSCNIVEDPSQSCSVCPNNCTHGCYNNACYICKDPLCAVCADRTSLACLACIPYSQGSPCQCFTSYFAYYSLCYKCFDRWDSCNGFGFHCNTCKNGYFIQNNFCLPNCSTGYYLLNSVCVFNYSEVINLDLSNPILLGNISEFTVGLYSNNSYPDYDKNDPWPAIERGYYFFNNTFMTSTLSLSPSLTLSV